MAHLALNTVLVGHSSTATTTRMLPPEATPAAVTRMAPASARGPWTPRVATRPETSWRAGAATARANAVLLGALVIDVEPVDPEEELGAPNDFGEDGADADASSVGDEVEGGDTLADRSDDRAGASHPEPGPADHREGDRDRRREPLGGRDPQAAARGLSGRVRGSAAPAVRGQAARWRTPIRSRWAATGSGTRSIRSLTSRGIVRPQKLAPHGMSLEDALRLKADAERYWAITPFEQTIQPSGVPLDVLFLFGFPGGAGGSMARGVGGTVSRHYADDVVRVGSSIVKEASAASARGWCRPCVARRCDARCARPPATAGWRRSSPASPRRASRREARRTDEAARTAMRALGLATDDAGHMGANAVGRQARRPDPAAPQRESRRLPPDGEVGGREGGHVARSWTC